MKAFMSLSESIGLCQSHNRVQDRTCCCVWKCCSVLQGVAVCCSLLQCVAMRSRAFSFESMSSCWSCCSVLHLPIRKVYRASQSTNPRSFQRDHHDTHAHLHSTSETAQIAAHLPCGMRPNLLPDTAATPFLAGSTRRPPLLLVEAPAPSPLESHLLVPGGTQHIRKRLHCADPCTTLYHLITLKCAAHLFVSCFITSNLFTTWWIWLYCIGKARVTQNLFNYKFLCCTLSI